jgi:hypothetical protein
LPDTFAREALCGPDVLQGRSLAGIEAENTGLDHGVTMTGAEVVELGASADRGALVREELRPLGATIA